MTERPRLVAALGSPASAACGPAHPTMLHALAEAAGTELGITLLGERGDEPATTWSYRRLAEVVWETAACLKAVGVGEGERVAILLPTGFDFVRVFLALQLVGAVPVPAYPPAALQQIEVALDRLRHVIADAGIRTCLTDRKLRPLVGALGVGPGAVERLLDVAALPAGRPEALRPALGETAFIQYTSGSTAEPRGVVVGHRALMHNIEAAGLASGVGPTDRMVTWLPLYHDMGLVGGLLWPIYWRIPLVLMPPFAFLQEPRRWLAAMSEHRGTITMAPSFAYARCVKRVRPGDLQGLDLSPWRIALNGAEPVSARVARELSALLAPCGVSPTVMYPCYGLAESVVAVTFSSPGEPLHSERLDRGALAEGRAAPSEAEEAIEVVSVGTAIPGHTVRVVDEQGNDVPERVIGEVVVGGPSLMSGYHGRQEESAGAIRDGELFTGDLGYLLGGRLFVTGRAKDLIIVRGRNFHAEDVEAVVEAVDGVRAGRSVAFAIYDDTRGADEVVVVVEGAPEGHGARAALVAAVQARATEVLGLALADVAFAPVGAIPKTPSGKRRRRLARQRYLDGTLAPPKPRLLALLTGSTVGLTVLRSRDLLARGARALDRLTGGRGSDDEG